MAAIKPLERIACEQCAPCHGAGVDASGKHAINVEYRPFSFTWFDANLKLCLEFGFMPAQLILTSIFRNLLGHLKYQIHNTL